MMLAGAAQGHGRGPLRDGGLTANRHNAFTLGTATTEVLRHARGDRGGGELLAPLVKEKESGKPLEPVIEEMNRLVKSYYDKSRPVYCAQHGMVDEVARMTDDSAATWPPSPAPPTRTRAPSAPSTR